MNQPSEYRTVRVYRGDARLLKQWADENGTIKPIAKVVHELVQSEAERREKAKQESVSRETLN